MDTPPAVNPFVPGRGQLPPFLAGREEEQRALGELLAYLQAGRGAPRDAILSGPRGNGKTVLLRWFQQEVEASARKIDTVWLTPSELGSLDALATLLVPPRQFRALRPDTVSFSIGIGRLGWELGGRSGSLTRLLAARCGQRPLVLLLDEAHTLDERVGQALLNASQSVSAEAPFLLAMAGTPGLQEHLNRMSATFWSRGEKLGIGLLDEVASGQALTRPLSDLNPPITFADAALAGVIGASQCYPYFLQLLGAALWTATRDAQSTRIDEGVVVRATRRFGVQRSACYEDRREELQRQELLDVAVRVAGAFDSRATLREHELDAVIADALPSDAATGDVHGLRDGLAGVGFVWKAPGDEDLWHPGIPSLMGYVASHAVTRPDGHTTARSRSRG